MAASAQRYPRDILLETDAEYQRLAEQHSKYEAELQKLSATPYLNSEDLLEESSITVHGPPRPNREPLGCGIVNLAFVNFGVLQNAERHC